MPTGGGGGWEIGQGGHAGGEGLEKLFQGLYEFRTTNEYEESQSA